jgi:sugar/nucleoside kinase (ribokinase family)
MPAHLVQARRPKTFDVICAGEPQWRLVRSHEGLARSSVRFRSSVLEIGRLLARTGIRVGLATVLDDDEQGRRAVQGLAATGVDVGGVVLSSAVRSLVVVDAGGGQSGVLAEREPERALDVPPAWSSDVLLLSGLSPLTSVAAALCKAARKARRDGTTVVVDFNASLRLWAGREPRTTFMVLREADVVGCTFADLAVLGVDAATVRKAMRAEAVLVIHDTTGATATGPFGEVRCALPRGDRHAAGMASDACTATICAELAGSSTPGESQGGRWHRVLRRWSSRLEQLD